jgi:glycosyltransferase involved in cell wall biosynthesis
LLSIIIPASNEEGYLGACLGALLASDAVAAEVIVVANGCRDATADVARGFAGQFATRDWGFSVLDLVEGSKPGALNAGDAVAVGDMRVYLDADVVVTRGTDARSGNVCGGDTTHSTGAQWRHAGLCAVLGDIAVCAKRGTGVWAVCGERTGSGQVAGFPADYLG